MSSLEKPVGLSSIVGRMVTERIDASAAVALPLSWLKRFARRARRARYRASSRSFEFAAEQHRTQLRKSGDPYLSHPLEVAHILADMKLDITTLCAALLHDVVEDTRISAARISERFRPDIARLVEGVTKINRLDPVGS